MVEVIVTTLEALAQAPILEEKGVVMGNSYGAIIVGEPLTTARNVEAAQKSALDYLKALAERLGANAVVGVRIERVHMGTYVDVLVYGTALKVDLRGSPYR